MKPETFVSSRENSFIFLRNFRVKSLYDQDFTNLQSCYKEIPQAKGYHNRIYLQSSEGCKSKGKVWAALAPSVATHRDKVSYHALPFTSY